MNGKFTWGDRVTPICSFDGFRTTVQFHPKFPPQPARELDKIGKPATVVNCNYDGDDYMLLFDGELGPCGWWSGNYLKKISK